jgi:hypothetical protein
LVRLTEEKTFFWSLGELSEIYGDKFIFVTKDSEGQIIGQAETQVQHWQTTKIGKLLHQYGRFRLYEIISFFDNRQHVFTNAVIITYHGEEHLVTPIVYNETDLAKVIQRVINEIETKDSKENILNEGLKITKDEETKQFIIKKLTEIEEYKQFLREALRELETN